MSDLQIFNNPDFGDIRIVERDGEPWFVGKDIAVALGYERPADAVRKHVDEEDRGVAKMETPSGDQQMTIINESGVYSLIFSSKLEKAQQFKRWVTSEVLPSIRKTGGYLTPAAEERLNVLQNDIQRLTDSVKVLQELVDPFVLLSLPDKLRKLTDRVTAMENTARDRIGALPALPAPLPENKEPDRQPPGRDYLKRWMRTASDKLNLMGSRYNMSNNAILHRLYGFLEEEFGVVLADERLRIMEEYNLDDCSTLKAIFYEADFRDYLEETIDHNLAPENRGW